MMQQTLIKKEDILYHKIQIVEQEYFQNKKEQA